ncbi:hypothetical protein [Bacillus sp. NPDC094106]|uniref:hypothetical protein n=1 Tax=Bacillus sp. NPDC094106 TaxID=3363949 RepID=UPI00382AC272
MKMLYLLMKEIMIGIEDFITERYLVSFYIMGFLLSYSCAFVLLSIGWCVYEWVIFGHLN